MEEGVRKALAVLVYLSAGALTGQEEAPSRLAQFEKAFPAMPKNAAAEDLDALGRALGFDPGGEAGDEHPAKADRDALLNAGHVAWLDAQLAASDDSILRPPPRFVAFLDSKQSALWHAVRLLERETPEWGFDPRQSRERFPELIFVVQLNRLLLSAALLEEREGRYAGAADLLEACWSLNLSVAGRAELVYQLIATACRRSLAGALRKMSEPLPEWTNRMAGREAVELVLKSLETDILIGHARDGTLTEDVFRSLAVRLMRVVSENLSERSVCDISRMSWEEIWGPAVEEVQSSASDEEKLELQTMAEISGPNLTNALHRAARLVVECELTARILELRQEKAASRHNRWPEKFYDTDSEACPGAEYEYRAVGGGMTIRFKGSIGKLEAPRLLPLSFEARPPKPLPTITPTRRPSPTPTPDPSLTPGKAGA
jgi:hypothetical protein